MLPMQGAWVWVPGQGTRSYMPQPRVHMPPTRDPARHNKDPAQPKKIKSINMEVYNSVVFKKGTQLFKKRQQHILCNLHGQLHMLWLFRPTFKGQMLSPLWGWGQVRIMLRKLSSHLPRFFLLASLAQSFLLSKWFFSSLNHKQTRDENWPHLELSL